MNMICWRSPATVGLLVAFGLLSAPGCGTTVAPPASQQAGTGLGQSVAEPDAARADVSGDVVQVAYTERSSATAPAKEKFDPVEQNGKYFEGWPKPKLALVISGRQDGYLEPCGCAGLENQKGGFNRRHALFQQLEKQGWPLASVDVGGLVRRFGRQAEIQFGISAEALKTMGYNAVGFGPSDLRLSAGEIVAAVAGAEPKDSIFVAANVNLFGLTPRVRIVQAGGMKLGITSVIGREYQQQINNAEVEIQPAAEALERVLPELKSCDIRILLAQATLEETKAFAKQFPKFDLVVCAMARTCRRPNRR